MRILFLDQDIVNGAVKILFGQCPARTIGSSTPTSGPTLAKAGTEGGNSFLSSTHVAVEGAFRLLDALLSHGSHLVGNFDRNLPRR